MTDFEGDGDLDLLVGDYNQRPGGGMYGSFPVRALLWRQESIALSFGTLDRSPLASEAMGNRTRFVLEAASTDCSSRRMPSAACRILGRRYETLSAAGSLRTDTLRPRRSHGQTLAYERSGALNLQFASAVSVQFERIVPLPIDERLELQQVTQFALSDSKWQTNKALR